MLDSRVDFSSNAGVYDRRHRSVLSEEELSRLWAGAGLHAGARVLDIGAGSGRIAIPLVRRGCRVVAIEPAAGMVERLRVKTEEAALETVAAVVGEGGRLPFRTGSFDVAVIARLLYLTPDWRAILREALRVLASQGRLLHEWGNGEAGEEWVRIREEARRLFEQAGVPQPFHPGVRSEAEVDDELGRLRLVRDREIEMGAGPTVTLREFLRRLVDGELSYVWNVPDQVRAAYLPRLERWAAQEFDLDRPVAMPRELRWTVHRKVEADSGSERSPVRLSALPDEQIGPLLSASEAEGFRFVRRVVDEWASGANRFTRPGEALLGSFLDGRLVGICGLTKDPYQDDDAVGRLRNLYVLPRYRGRRIGATLTRCVTELARSSFRILRLRAATPQAAALYERLGFTATTELENCTHVIRFPAKKA